MSAADRWSSALADWAIPERILSQAAESPWDLPPWVFSEAANRSLTLPPTPTHLLINAHLPTGGVLLDVGAGGGAASLPLAAKAGSIVAVDQSPTMLRQFLQLAEGRAAATTVVGHWPEVATQVEVADVVVCANVAYNVSALGDFVEELTHKARRSVVMELTASHPQAPLSWLWKHFWQLDRPTSPTAEDALEVIRERLRTEVQVVTWTGPEPLATAVSPEAVAWTRRRLCLEPGREGEIRDLLLTHPGATPGQMVTLGWRGDAAEG